MIQAETRIPHTERLGDGGRCVEESSSVRVRSEKASFGTLSFAHSATPVSHAIEEPTGKLWSITVVAENEERQLCAHVIVVRATGRTPENLSARLQPSPVGQKALVLSNIAA